MTTNNATANAPVRQKTTTSKRKQAVAGETHDTIAAQTAAFLKSGGSINKVKSGVSGQQKLTGPRHISLN